MIWYFFFKGELPIALRRAESASAAIVNYCALQHKTWQQLQEDGVSVREESSLDTAELHKIHHAFTEMDKLNTKIDKILHPQPKYEEVRTPVETPLETRVLFRDQKGDWDMSVEQLKDYVAKCGLPDVTVDKDTLLLSTSGVYSIGELAPHGCQEHGLDYSGVYSILEPHGCQEHSLDYFVNLEYPHKVWNNKKTPDGIEVHSGENGVFIVSPEKRLMMFCPIYECHGATVRKNLVQVVGHEEVATIVLNNLDDSFCEHTR